MTAYTIRRRFITLYEGLSVFGTIAFLAYLGSEESGNWLCNLIRTWIEN